MTLLIRWDAADTTYLSGGPGSRYVHFPVEVSSSVPTLAGVAVTALDAAGAVIAEQTYDGLSLSETWLKFSPAILIPDTAVPKTLKVLLYSIGAPVATPRLITKSLGGIGGSSNMLIAVVGIGLIYVLAKSKSFKRYLR